MSILKQGLVILILVAVGAGGYLAYDRYADSEASSGNPRERARSSSVLVETAPVARQTIERRVEAVGTTLAARAVEIVPLASGRIEAIEFKAGQRVDKGAVLVRLDDDIEQANYAQAKAELGEISTRLTRSRTLRTKNAVTQATVDQIVAEEAAAKAELDRARRRLADRVVRAPFAGIVGFNRVEIGARVDDDTVITTLDDLREIDVEFALPEILFGQVRAGHPVIADSVAFPGRRFDGTITLIDSRIDPVSRAFSVRARVPNPDLALPAGMFMHLAVIMETRSALMVPEEAILAQGGKTFAFLIEDGVAQRKELVLGYRQDGKVEIIEGAEENDTIVTSGLQRLRDGVAIRTGAPSGGRPGGRPGGGPSGGGAGS